MLPWPRIFPYRHEFHAAALRPKHGSTLVFLASWLKHSYSTQLSYDSNKYSILPCFRYRTSDLLGRIDCESWISADMVCCRRLRRAETDVAPERIEATLHKLYTSTSLLELLAKRNTQTRSKSLNEHHQAEDYSNRSQYTQTISRKTSNRS